jgi:hypothetical protein
MKGYTALIELLVAFLYTKGIHELCFCADQSSGKFLSLTTAD